MPVFDGRQDAPTDPGDVSGTPPPAERPRRWEPSLFWVSIAVAGVALVAVGLEEVAHRRGPQAESVESAAGPDEELVPRALVPVELPATSRYPASVARFPAHLPVVGVSVGDEHRAYLLDTMTNLERHVLEDRFGDQPVAVTYCDRTDHGKVYCGPAGGDPLGVRAVAFSRTRGMVLANGADRFYQDAAAGHPPTGSTRPPDELASERTTWGEWVNRHPDAVTVCYPTLATSTTRNTYPGRLVRPSDDPVVGLTVNGRPRAYLVETFADVAGYVLEDFVAGETALVVHCAEQGRTRAFHIPSGDRPAALSFAGWNVRTPAGGPLLDDGARLYSTFPVPPRGANEPGEFPFAEIPSVRTTWREWVADHPDSSLYVGRLVDRVGLEPPDARLFPAWLRFGLIGVAAVGMATFLILYGRWTARPVPR